MPKPREPSAPAKFFTRIGARGWRRSGYDTFAYSFPFFRRWVASQFAAERLETLSIGCGSGELEQHLAECGHAVIGLDLSHTLLKRASRKGLELLVQADAGRLPFGAARFDLVLIMETIGYFALDAVFEEARRVLRRRGRLVITSYGALAEVHALYRCWTMDEIADRLRAAGFRIEAQRYLDIKRRSVRDAPSAERSNLLYLSASASNRQVAEEEPIPRSRAQGASSPAGSLIGKVADSD
jgi:ubiquinone/menaquinone biosynthesis C-methylase UbiE